MSQFLPEIPTQGAPVGVKPQSEADPVTQEDMALMLRVVNAMAQNPSMIPDTLMSYIQDWLQVSNLQIPIGQVFGFQKFVSTQVSVQQATAPNLSAGNNQTLTQAGPTLTLQPGAYVLVAGYYQSVGSGGNLAFSPVSLTVEGGAGGSMAAAI